MIITALTKFTAIDYPGRLACILFTGGCNLRCGFCHNAEFVLPDRLKEITQTIPFETVINFLKQRQGMLDGVSICGGEPTLHPDLPDKIRQIKELGFLVKLDTNGTNPLMVERLMEENLVDYWAMDLKDALPYREELVGLKINPDLIRRSIELIMHKRTEYEFRSTILPKFHTVETLLAMAESISGAEKWVLQGFRNEKTLREEFSGMAGYGPAELEELSKILAGRVKVVECRPA
jgi:pyruvate formate lyase activating enzyme